ncbi:hypothetical protein [Radiobacillus sp. PE A8.2]|uniref:hypothetical protein n=1 Tax=Radiobacillus sp. PE A8.2 TaxID=3380349 RepID=UPI0038903E52
MKNQTKTCKPEFSFCVTNLDMYSNEAEIDLRNEGFKTIEFHCLGLCVDCMQGPVALLNNKEMIDPEYWIDNEIRGHKR